MAKKYKYQKYFTFNHHRYVVRADTKEELAVKEYRKRQGLEGLVKTIDRNMFVKDWAKEWMETYKLPTVATETYNSYISPLRNHILPVIGTMKMKAVKPVHCQKVLNTMQGKGYAYGYMRLAKVVMRDMFHVAEQNELTLSNPASDLVVPKGPVSESRALTPYEETMCLQLAETHPFGIIAKLMFYCGVRTGESVAMRWMDVDLQKNIMNIRHTIKRNTKGIGLTKTDAGLRSVPIPIAFASELASMKGEPFNYIVGNRTTPLNAMGIHRLWVSFVNDLNILMGCSQIDGVALPPYRAADDLRPYYFRHTYCTHLQDAGVPINIARQFMGHKSILVTQKIYTHSTETSFEKARSLIDGVQPPVQHTGDNR